MEFEHVDLYDGTFDPARYGVVRFDYRGLTGALQFHAVVEDRMLDLPWLPLVADDKWHTLVLPLSTVLQQAGWTAGQQVEHLIVRPIGPLRIDNLRISER